MVEDFRLNVSIRPVEDRGHLLYQSACVALSEEVDELVLVDTSIFQFRDLIFVFRVLFTISLRRQFENSFDN